MKMCETELKVKTLKLEYENIKRDYFAFLPSCQLRCGLLQNLSCGRKHKTQTQIFFHPRLNFPYCWPAFNRAEIQLSDLLTVLKTDTNSLSYTWDPSTHPQILLEYIYTLMSCQQTGVKPVRGLDTVKLQFHPDLSGGKADEKNPDNSEHKGIITLGVGRPQSTILGDQHTILGSGIFRILSLQGSFGLSILTLAHVRANHKRQRTKSLLLRMGFSIQKLESLLYSQQQNCDFCRRKKAARKNRSLGMAVSASGASQALAALCFDSNQHVFATDIFGPLVLQHDQKVWAIVFVSLITGFTYTFVVTDLTAESVCGAVLRLVAVSGQVKLVLSDQGSNLSPWAQHSSLIKVDGSAEEGVPDANNSPYNILENQSTSSRTPQQPLRRLLQTAERIQGSSIMWKLGSANFSEQQSVVELAVKSLKHSLTDSNFHQKCQNYSVTNCETSFAVATASYNSRPVVQLENGTFFSPFDIMSLMLSTCQEPTNGLTLFSNDKKIRQGFYRLQQMKTELQSSMFDTYCRYLY